MFGANKVLKRQQCKETMAAVAVVGAAAISYEGTRQASDAASAANQQNIDFQQQYNMQHDPFSTSGARAQYVGQLNQLMQGGYQNIQNDPMFQWQQKQGMEAVQRRMAAMGQGVGTNDLLAIQNQAVGQSASYFDQQYQRLAALSGASGGQSTVPQGMSPQTAGQITMAPYQSLAQGLGGIASLYGTPGSPTTPTSNTGGGIYTGAYNPSSTGTYDPNPTGTNP